jgi:hypothetical protein
MARSVEIDELEEVNWTEFSSGAADIKFAFKSIRVGYKPEPVFEINLTFRRVE